MSTANYHKMMQSCGEAGEAASEAIELEITLVHTVC